MKELNGEEFYKFVRNKIAVVDFWAPWCMPCLVLSPVLEELEKEMEIPFGKVNVDENIDIAREFGIMSIPTIIIFSNGEEVERIVGALPKEEIKEKINYYRGNLFP